VIAFLRTDVIPHVAARGRTKRAEKFRSSARRDFFNSIRTSRASGDVRFESATLNALVTSLLVPLAVTLLVR
jgi:hypothetical protein